MDLPGRGLGTRVEAIISGVAEEVVEDGDGKKKTTANPKVLVERTQASFLKKIFLPRLPIQKACMQVKVTILLLIPRLTIRNYFAPKTT